MVMRTRGGGTRPAQPAAEPAAQPTAQPAAEPAAQPARQPARQPAAQSARQPARQPAAQSARQPARQPAAQPAAQTRQHPQPQLDPDEPIVQPDHQLATAIDPMMYGDDLGKGLENADADSFAIPFVRVLQELSPQCHSKTGIPDAEPGMLFNSATGELYHADRDNPEVQPEALFIPCAYERRFLRWGPKRGDGLRGVYTPDEVDQLQADGRVREIDRLLLLPDTSGAFDPKTSDRLSDTRSHYGLILRADGAGEARQVIISLASTQIKQSRLLMANLSHQTARVGRQVVTLPTWANVYSISTQMEQKNTDTWFGIRFTHLQHLDMKDEDDALLYAMGKTFHHQIIGGHAQVDYGQAADPPPQSSDDDPTSGFDPNDPGFDPNDPGFDPNDLGFDPGDVR